VSLPGYSDYFDAGAEGRFVFKMRAGTISLSQLPRRTIDSNLTSSGYLAWKRFARAAPSAPLWYYAPDFGGLSSGALIHPFWRWSDRVVALTASSLMEVLLAAQRGDRTGAADATRELLAAGLALGRQPVPSASLAGMTAIRRGVTATRELARRWGDMALASRAESVQRLLSRNAKVYERYGSYQLAERVEGGAFAMGPIMLVSDPASKSASEALTGRDPSNVAFMRTPLDPVDRWQLIAAVVPAFCTSPREVLSGIDPQRGAALESALGRQRDLPRTDEWIRANLRWYRAMRDDPGRATGSPNGPALQGPWFLKPLGWIGLGRMRDRIVFCRQFLWH
jgi:hypothetical protein